MICCFRDKKGVTMLELMVAVAIVGILATIAIPAYMRYVKRSRTAQATEFLMEIYQAEFVFQSDRIVSGGEFLMLPSLLGGVPAGGVTNVPALVGNWRTLSADPGLDAIRFDFWVTTDGGHATGAGPGIRNACGQMPAAALPAGDPWFVAEAAGDQDGDANQSGFTITSTNRVICRFNELE